MVLYYVLHSLLLLFRMDLTHYDVSILLIHQVGHIEELLYNCAYFFDRQIKGGHIELNLKQF